MVVSSCLNIDVIVEANLVPLKADITTWPEMKEPDSMRVQAAPQVGAYGGWWCGAHVHLYLSMEYTVDWFFLNCGVRRRIN